MQEHYWIYDQCGILLLYLVNVATYKEDRYQQLVLHLICCGVHDGVVMPWFVYFPSEQIPEKDLPQSGPLNIWLPDRLNTHRVCQGLFIIVSVWETFPLYYSRHLNSNPSGRWRLVEWVVPRCLPGILPIDGRYWIPLSTKQAVTNSKDNI